MRARLIAVFLIPLVGILLVLGSAYAWIAGRSIEQQFHAAQLGDLTYFVTSARQALQSGNPNAVEGEMERYYELFGTRVAVMDRSGTLFAPRSLEPAELDESAGAQVRLALSGRRAEPPATLLPWSGADSVMVEPVFDRGDVIGAVVISASVDAPRAEILRQWALLVLIAVIGTSLSVLVVVRVANWVLHPLRRLDRAMEAMEKGEMDARISEDTGPPELRRMTLVFNSMADEIERVVSRQQEFALNASHELRNPLNALLLRVEFLATGLGPEWDGDVDSTREEGRRMTRILDTLLNLARSGHGDAAFAVVDITKLAQQRAESWREVAAKKNIRIELLGEPSVLSVTDKTIVESALDAVIDNAVKFSPAGGIVEVWPQQAGQGSQIAVRDYGPGLSDEELTRVGDRFWRSPRSQNQPGSGLGLAIANDLMRSIGGAVSVDAPLGGGLQVNLQLGADRLVRELA